MQILRLVDITTLIAPGWRRPNLVRNKTHYLLS